MTVDCCSDSLGKVTLCAGRDWDEEDERGVPAVPRPVSPVRMSAPDLAHASAPPHQTGQAEGADAMLRAIQIVQSKGKECFLNHRAQAAKLGGTGVHALAQTSAHREACHCRPQCKS